MGEGFEELRERFVAVFGESGEAVHGVEGAGFAFGQEELDSLEPLRAFDEEEMAEDVAGAPCVGTLVAVSP